MRGRCRWMCLSVVVAVVLAVAVAVVVGDRAVAVAQPSPSPPPQAPAPAQDSPEPDAPATGDVADPTPTTGTEESGGSEQEPDATPAPPSDPATPPSPDATEDDQGSEADVVPSDRPTPDVVPPEDRGGVAPSVRRSGIAPGTIVLAVVVLAVVALGVVVVGRQAGRRTDQVGSAGRSPTTARAPTSGRGPGSDRELVAFLLELGEALVDAGDAVNRVAVELRAVARVAGLPDVGVLVLPTALVISVPGRQDVQTAVTAAGSNRLRLDQIEEVLLLVDLASHGGIEPTLGRRRLAEIRAAPSPVTVPLALAGNALAAVGLALVVGGDVAEVALAGLLGAAVGALQVVPGPRRPTSLRPFMPLVASFVVAIVVFLVARVAPDLAILPPLVAPLIPLLPGGLLTMGTLELATGEAVSGVARLGSGGLQLVLLAAGVLGAAQLVGLPASTGVTAAVASGTGGVIGVVAPWLGVVVFGLGVGWAHAARRSSVPWILVVLYAAYAGQILGGLFFGTSLSAFFGALAMTPVAVHVARLRRGPPALVTFLPAFWLLVPGALGLEGVTRILSDQGPQGVDTLVTTGTSMVGIALGILLGVMATVPDQWHLPDWGRRRV